jgi:S-adenosylmethionine hydrolase
MTSRTENIHDRGQVPARPVISLLTDFGSKGGYTGAVKAVILSRVSADLVDITNDVSPQSVVEGAFVLKSAFRYFPPGTVHLVVVDPGVGGTRRALAIRSGSHYFVGPDNGILVPAARSSGRMEIREINMEKLGIDSVSSTFHGRDIFAPAAAFVAQGNDFSRIGRLLKNCMELDFGPVREIPGGIEGICLYSDTFGNVITNIPGKVFSRKFRMGEKLAVTCTDSQHIADYCKTYSSGGSEKIIVLKGSHENMEIAIPGGNAAAFLNCMPSSEISVRKLRF